MKAASNIFLTDSYVQPNVQNVDLEKQYSVARILLDLGLTLNFYQPKKLVICQENNQHVFTIVKRDYPDRVCILTGELNEVVCRLFKGNHSKKQIPETDYCIDVWQGKIWNDICCSVIIENV